MASGSVLAGLLLLAWSQVESLVVFYILFAGIGLLQADPLRTGLRRCRAFFGAANARSPITALTLWGGFASTAFIPLIQLLLDHFGWRGDFGSCSAASILCNVPGSIGPSVAQPRTHCGARTPKG
jgi:hypothetical protein